MLGLRQRKLRTYRREKLRRQDSPQNSADSVESVPVSGDVLAAQEELRRDIRKLAYFNGGHSAADITSVAARNMNMSQLIDLKKFLEKKCYGRGVEIQLEPKNDDDNMTSEFSLG